MNPGLFLVLGSLALIFLRFRQPWTGRISGDVIRKLSVPVRGRVRLQRANVYAVGALLFLGGAGGWIPPLAQIGVVCLVLAALLLPLEYTLTTDGIALGRTPMRRWNEFKRVDSADGRVLLIGLDDKVMTVLLPSSSGWSSEVAEFRRLVNGVNAGGEKGNPRPISKGSTSRRVTPKVI